MNSENEAFKTNEFLRRRKLRLQQVREQSKDIAKKIRQRAKVEKLRTVVELDAKKQKEYFERQEKFVKHLEVLYTRGLDNVGASHQNASELAGQAEASKVDLSKSRGKEAIAELRRIRQEKLDEQKKLLDRKLDARKAANELSREKSTVTASKLTTKSIASQTKSTEAVDQDTVEEPEVTNDKNKEIDGNKPETQSVKTIDKSTQWAVENMPYEWVPAIPALSLPDDKSARDSDPADFPTKSTKVKRLDLFATSKEMPSDLRGTTSLGTERTHFSTRPSLTLVSEYLQSRKLRLRENEVSTNKKPMDDIASLKQTIHRTRISKPDEGTYVDMCHVLDEKIIPVPSWQQGSGCQFCEPPATATVTATKSFVNKKQFKTYTSYTKSQVHKVFNTGNTLQKSYSRPIPCPKLRGLSPFQRQKISPELFSGDRNSIEKEGLTKKSSVTMYNHSTKNTKDLPCGDGNMVMRDLRSEEDAYSLAMKESSLDQGREVDHQTKVQDMRNKVAMTKQSVEKEYKDTINFLNTLPKNLGGKVIKRAYMDDRRQQMEQQQRQHKMQQEYRKIEKECKKKHSCMNKNHITKRKSLAQAALDEADFQYSWMPVPESDGNLAIHAIPNSKAGKSNSVKFSQADDYHEYRSRHKHTPPTKDNPDEIQSKTKQRKTTFINQSASESSDECETEASTDTSSVENMRLEKTKKTKKLDENTSDAERIIIYKILDSQHDKKAKSQTKLLNDIVKSLSSIERSNNKVDQTEKNKADRSNKTSATTVSFEELNEGVYKLTEGKEAYNMMCSYQTNIGLWFSEMSQKPLWDKISALCVEDNQCGDATGLNDHQNHPSHSNKINMNENKPKSVPVFWDCGDVCQRTSDSTCQCRSKESMKNTPSTKTSSSTSTFKTAFIDKPTDSQTDGGFVRFVDETGQEKGKFFIGASGFLNNNAYEVVIKLRKKNDTKKESDVDSEEPATLPNDNAVNGLTNDDVNIEKKKSDINASSVPSTTNDIQQTEARTVSEAKSLKITTKDTVSQKSIVINIESKEKMSACNLDNNVTNTESNNVLPMKSSEEKKMVDKSVLTSLKMDEASKVEPMSRPATTTYTQTTSSPIHRPVYVHMSSSTSTAYLSPPDMILPNLLRQDYELLHGDHMMYNPKSNKQDYCDGYIDCTCRKCLKAKSTFNKNDYYSAKLNIWTPPNTATSCSKHKHDSNEGEHHQKQHSARRSRCSCCKYLGDDLYKERQKPCKKSHNSDEMRESKNVYRKLNMRCSANIIPKSTANKTPLNDKCKTKLKPVVKSYVNKLLALNKKGLKAIEIANQDCSSVTTPGSSIINVANNVDERKSSVMEKISLQQIKETIKQQVMENLESLKSSYPNPSNLHSSKYSCSRPTRKKHVHKIKSLNISRSLLKKSRSNSKRLTSVTSTDDNNKPQVSINRVAIPLRTNVRSRSSPTPRPAGTSEPSTKFNDSATSSKNSAKTEYSKRTTKTKSTSPPVRSNGSDKKPCRTTKSLARPDLQIIGQSQICNDKTDETTTNHATINNGDDANFMKLVEDKLHNMEKIADLTEKCTKRLSNLAKVLDEVRKNKSLAYSQISASDSADSQCGHKYDKGTSSKAVEDESNGTDVSQSLESKSPPNVIDKELEEEKLNLDYVSILTDIPKPDSLVPEVNPMGTLGNSKSSDHLNVMSSSEHAKRPKPPPAVYRTKHGREIIPHELSTVIEVDSPMSVKNKNLTSRTDTKSEMIVNDSNILSNEKETSERNNTASNRKTSKDGVRINPDLLQSNAKLIKRSHKKSTGESSDDSKFQMMDLKHFNEIMLEPFISIQDYAKQYNVEPPDEGSNMEDIQKDDVINDDFSSMHSDGSLPDVIAELLKRNIIAEPFKFDTPSNVNSTTVSSESTLSMLALSHVRKENKRSVLFRNKENIAETSDTLSISSNPDLENAFKKLGMGWASSTLKKTKERLALSSSSNTSSSSMSQFKIKSFNQDIPVIVTDTISSVHNQPVKGHHAKNSINPAKHAEQQTSLVNSMTVKEFLTNELAKKITFNNKSSMMNDTEQEFVSLFETKMPEELKQTYETTNREEASVNTTRNSANRARTSTPVQIYKSMTYHSSSSSNLSNGLFSNADDLSSVKMTSHSNKNHSTSEKDDLTIPNFSLKMKKSSDCSKSDE